MKIKKAKLPPICKTCNWSRIIEDDDYECVNRTVCDQVNSGYMRDIDKAWHPVKWDNVCEEWQKDEEYYGCHLE